MYRGLSTFITFAPACVAVRFWAFDTSQRAIETAYPGIEERYLHFAAGLCSGAVEAALVLVPMETIAITLMHDQMSAERKYRGLVGPMVTMVREQGPRGVYRGLLPQVRASAPPPEAAGPQVSPATFALRARGAAARKELAQYVHTLRDVRRAEEEGARPARGEPSIHGTSGVRYACTPRLC